MLVLPLVVFTWYYEKFDTEIKTFSNHYERILDFFNETRTNGIAETFNSKLKCVRVANELSLYPYKVKPLLASYQVLKYKNIK
ncbi:MAG: transposase [Prevotella sp.]